MLELQNISFQVDAEGQDKEIIRDISLTIPDDKLVVITGPNGGGKSTLARLIIGIEKRSRVQMKSSFEMIFVEKSGKLPVSNASIIVTQCESFLFAFRIKHSDCLHISGLHVCTCTFRLSVRFRDGAF